MDKTGNSCFAAGIAVTVLMNFLGNYGEILEIYALLNVTDWLTGWYKARKNKEESSKAGIRGLLKKLGYWIIILIAFLLPHIFVSLGRELLGMDLTFLAMIGWFTLANLIINEIRSILENLVACGYRIPGILSKGLAVTQKMMEEKENDTGKENAGK